MILARVLGTVVSTRKDRGLVGLKLLLTREVDELVLLAAGSSARMTEVSREKPVDAVIVGIVDAVEIEGRDAYLKHGGVVSAPARKS